jgi:hypothetical protein
MALTFSLFSSFSSFSGEVPSIVDMYNRIPADTSVVRKKICKGGFKSMIKTHQFGTPEVVYSEDTSHATFAEFKINSNNIVIGFYSNGKIRMAGKMSEDMDVNYLGKTILRHILGVQEPVMDFALNNITAMFRMTHSVSCCDVAAMFKDHITDIIYPGGEVPPYTVVRMIWKGYANVLVNYTPNTGAFQILGCTTVGDIQKIYKAVQSIFANSEFTQEKLNMDLYKNKFELVGMKKVGRGRPTRQFIEEYNQRIIMLQGGSGALDSQGAWVPVS